MDELRRVLNQGNSHFLTELKTRWGTFCERAQFYGVFKKLTRPPQLDKGDYYLWPCLFINWLQETEWHFFFNSKALNCHDEGFTRDVPITYGPTQEVKACKWGCAPRPWGKKMYKNCLMSLQRVKCCDHICFPFCDDFFVCFCVSLQKTPTPFSRHDHSPALLSSSAKPTVYWPLEPCPCSSSQKRTFMKAWCISWHVITPFTSPILSALQRFCLWCRQKSSWTPFTTVTWLLHTKRLWPTGKSS